MRVKKLISGVLSAVLMTSCISSTGYALNTESVEIAYSKKCVNPSRQEIEEKIERVAIKYSIPPVILKSIALVESGMNQFKKSQPYVYQGKSYGILQVTPNKKDGFTYDYDRLKYDIDYNLEMGAKLIKDKWDYSFGKYWSVSKAGNMDPRILENWYFTIWAYNSWSSSNNPNTRKTPYQLKVINYAESEFGQVIHPIDPKILPKEGRPDTKNTYEISKDYHLVDFIGAKKGDIVIDKSPLYTNEKTKITSKANGDVIGELSGKYPIEIMEEPMLIKGTLYYKVIEVRDDNKKVEGWAELKKVEKDLNSTNKDMDFDKSGEIDIFDLRNILEAKIKFDKNSNKKLLEKYDLNNDNNIDEYDIKIVDKNTNVQLMNYEHYDDDKVSMFAFDEKVDIDKVFKIEMNKEITKEVFDKTMITVIDDEGSIHGIEGKLLEDNKTLSISPLEAYESNETYYMIISITDIETEEQKTIVFKFKVN